MAISTRAANGAVVSAGGRATGVLVTDPACTPPVRDAYAQTLLNLRYALYGSGGTSVLVSAVDDTSNAAIVAANLAILAAQEGERVVLVDTDPRHGSLSSLFDLAEVPGFTSLIRQEGMNPTASLQQVDVPNLYLLGVEKGRLIPGGLARADGLPGVLTRLKHISDRLFLIGAPILGSIDSLDLCAHVDGVLITIGQDRTHRDDVGRARTILKRAHASVIGVVLTN